MRDAPSVDIIKSIIKSGAKVKAFDPVATEKAKEALPDIEYCKETYDTAENCDALIFMTEWNQFRSLDMQKLLSKLKTPMVFDLRNIYEPTKMKKLGFKYFCVGRQNGSAGE